MEHAVKYYHPKIIIFNYDHLDKDACNLIKLTANINDTIPLIIRAPAFSTPFAAYPHIQFIRPEDNNALFNALESLGVQKINWDELVPFVKQFILSNIPQLLTVHELAHRLGLRKRELSEQFKYRTNQGIKIFIDSAKLELVKIVLTKKGLNTKYYEVAFECGFKDEACLASFIKHKTGMTLSEFHEEARRQNKKSI